jgi:hypothetical protein
VLSWAVLAASLLAGCASPHTSPKVRAVVGEISRDNLRATVERLAAFGTRHTLSETESDTRGIGAARRWIKAELDRYAAESGGRLQVELQSFTAKADGKRIFRDVEIVNVLAVLPGTDPASKDRIYLVSGHYDSISSDVNDAESDAPGANDDASGVAVVMELVRVMSRHPFDATVVFACVAGEEQGLFGSRFLAKQYRLRNANIAGMITNDIVGNSVSTLGVNDDRRLRVFSEGVPTAESEEDRKVRIAIGGESDSPARQLARFVNDAAAAYVPAFDAMLVMRRDRFLRGGDHTAFSEQGYAAVRLTEMQENFDRQHQNVRVENGRDYGDTVEHVDFDYLTRVAKVNAAALASLALAPAPPANCRILAAKLENTTTLAWDIGKEPDLAGYEVVWRETTAPQWQQARNVGRVATYTHELSKDHYQFGVRAIDRDGHRSVVAFPVPARE